jgi:hypothetical protein
LLVSFSGFGMGNLGRDRETTSKPDYARTSFTGFVPASVSGTGREPT